MATLEAFESSVCPREKSSMLEGAHGDELKNKMQTEKERERGVGGECRNWLGPSLECKTNVITAWIHTEMSINSILNPV